MAISGSTAPVPRWHRLDSRRGFLVSGSAAVGAAVGAVVPLMCSSTAATTTPSAAQWPSSLFLLPMLVVGVVRGPSVSTTGPERHYRLSPQAVVPLSQAAVPLRPTVVPLAPAVVQLIRLRHAFCFAPLSVFYLPGGSTAPLSGSTARARTEHLTVGFGSPYKRGSSSPFNIIL